MKVALYARVSTIDQHPENQLLALQEYVKNHPELEVFETYQDKTSGAKSSRPELDRLMQDARKRKFQHCIIWSVDRLGRSPAHMHQVVEEWKRLGIGFTVTTLGIDTSTPVGEFVFGLLAQVAKLEREFTRERTLLAYKRAKKEKRHWGRPKGSKDKEPRNKSGYVYRWAKNKQPTPQF